MWFVATDVGHFLWSQLVQLRIWFARNAVPASLCVKKGKVSVFDDTRSEEELAKKRHARLTRYAAKINEIVK